MSPQLASGLLVRWLFWVTNAKIRAPDLTSFYLNLLLEGMFEKKRSRLDSTSISTKSMAMQLVYKFDSVNCLVISDYLVTSYHFLFISLWSGLITCSSLPAFGFWSGFFNFISRLNRKPFKHSSELQLGVCHEKYLAPEIDHSQNRFPTKLKTEVGMTACKKTCVW